MPTIKENSIRHEVDQYSRFLAEKVDDFGRLTPAEQGAVRALFTYCVAHSPSDSLLAGLPLGFRIRHSTMAAHGIEFPSIVLSNPRPLFSLLSGGVPSHNRTSFPIEKLIDVTAKYYASSGCAVVDSKLALADNLTKPILFSLDVEPANNTGAAVLTQPKYHAYAVTVDAESSIRLEGEYDFLRILSSFGTAGAPIAYSQVRDEADFGYAVRMASQFGYKFSLNADLLAAAIQPKTFLCIVPLSDAEKFEEACCPFSLTSCGVLSEGAGESVLVRKGETLHLSSILLDEIILAAIQYQFYGNSAMALAQLETAAAPYRRPAERSIQDVLENMEYMSACQLAARFDPCMNTHQASIARSPYASYFAVKDVGRFLVSLNTLVPGGGGDLGSTLRVIFEHQAYGATPALALVRLVEQPRNAGEGQRVVDELTSFFDIFSIQCRIEREEVACLSSAYVLSLGLVSRLDQKVGELMSGFKQKGDVIYMLNLRSGGAAQDQEPLLSSGIIPNLVSLKLVNALAPISRGGLFYSLYSMGDSLNLGFDITGDSEQSEEVFLFDDTIGRAILTVSEEHEVHLIDYIREAGASITLLGHVTKGEIRIDDVSYGFIADLKKKVSFAFQNNIKKMASKKVVKPYEDSQSTKKEQVASMFDNIAPKYDFLNHFLSLGIDKLWRKKLVKEVGKYKPSRILDVATGTGDLAIALSKLNPQNIVGIDIAVKMVEVGIDKVKERGLDKVIYLQQGDSETINFDSSTFDFATVAFGVRNFENPLLGLREMHRVLKSGGGIAVLEFAMPTKFPIKQFYKFYFFKILPFIGRLFSKDNSAYTYLPESVEAFPSGANFVALLKEAGFSKTRIIPLTFGVANIYIGEK
jgi:demethylmenaquinone methyltransferase / 2-methoxy-6-polyprenyl-1,4-benzoquinol methylase